MESSQTREVQYAFLYRLPLELVLARLWLLLAQSIFKSLIFGVHGTLRLALPLKPSTTFSQLQPLYPPTRLVLFHIADGAQALHLP